MTLAPEKLGPKLKSERERRNLTLEHISASTKIPVPLLDALERDDLSRWPKGLYRRAFFRSYVTALGLRPEPLTTEFARLFPDETAGPVPARSAVLDVGRTEGGDVNSAATRVQAPLALTLARRQRAGYRIRRHALVALLELAVIVGIGAAAAWALQTTVLQASGVLALLYYPLVTVVAGKVRRPWNVAHAERAARRLGATVTPAAAQRAAIRDHVARAGHALVATGRSGGSLFVGAAAAVRTHVARRWLPILAHCSRGMIRALTSAAIVAVRPLGRLGRSTNRIAGRTRRRAIFVFWRAVGTISEHAYLLASRQMNRTKP